MPLTLSRRPPLSTLAPPSLAAPSLCQLEAFGNPLFLEFIKQLLLRIPVGARRLNLNNLSFIFVALVGRLSFVEINEKMEYGQLDERKFSQDKYESIQSWLMDADKCPTTWSELLRIRAENPNYNVNMLAP